MLLMFLKIALRNLLKNKIYSGINILGLAMGLSVSIIIGIWVMDEFQYDTTMHPKRERLAQVKTTQTFNDHTATNDAISIPLALELRANYSSDFKNVCLAS